MTVEIKLDDRFEVGDLILGVDSTDRDRWAVWTLVTDGDIDREHLLHSICLFSSGNPDLVKYPRYYKDTEVNNRWEWSKITDLEELTKELKGLKL